MIISKFDYLEMQILEICEDSDSIEHLLSEREDLEQLIFSY